MPKLTRIIWKEAFIEKLESKHQVSRDEVEGVLTGRIKAYRLAKGDVRGEEVYLALGRTRAGRYLAVFFILKKDHSVLPISARDMDEKERGRYAHE
jgi:uncharacterized DUF497 family protein